MQNAAKFKRIKVTPRDVIKPMAALLSLNIIVLTVWTVVDPLRSEVEIVDTDVFGRPIETQGKMKNDVCIVFHSSTSTLIFLVFHLAQCTSDKAHIFGPILLVINLGCLVISLIQAFKARNISTELSESKYIFRALSIIIYVSFLAIPVMVIARDSSDAWYLVTSGLIFVVCTSILLLIFMPKVLAVRKKKNQPTTPNNTKKQWGLTTNNAKADRTKGESDEEVDSTSSGIRILGTEANSALRKENEELRELIKELNRNQELEQTDTVQNDNLMEEGLGPNDTEKNGIGLKKKSEQDES